jgi:hypothetical protein
VEVESLRVEIVSAERLIRGGRFRATLQSTLQYRWVVFGCVGLAGCVGGFDALCYIDFGWKLK